MKQRNCGSSRFCVISLTYNMIDLCVLCVFVVRSTPSLGVMYLRIHFTHQTWESRVFSLLKETCVLTEINKMQCYSDGNSLGDLGLYIKR